MRFKLILWGLAWLVRYARWRYPAFRARLAERDIAVQIRTADHRTGRYLVFRRGAVRSRGGLHPDPTVSLVFKNAIIGARLLTPPIDQLEQVDALKNFLVRLEGPDEDAVWFAQTIMAALSAGWRFGREMGDGTTRFCTMTNGGPLFVYVKDGRMVRTTPIEFDSHDPPSWTISARGETFTPPRKGTLAPHAMNWKAKGPEG